MVVNEVNQMFLSGKAKKACAEADAGLDDVMAGLGFAAWQKVEAT